ncbi:hypothetical protein PAHAL_8G027400 [Panicum hallii]|uniref:Uncharacterized protein n=1 Tax=Panicum hallii TaxID=206008 RepID=A0A2S3ICB8_9POAL|nr:hypothetical protein PAHAL_8G027400 [Panicum hallii]
MSFGSAHRCICWCAAEVTSTSLAESTTVPCDSGKDSGEGRSRGAAKRARLRVAGKPSPRAAHSALHTKP